MSRRVDVAFYGGLVALLAALIAVGWLAARSAQRRADDKLVAARVAWDQRTAVILGVEAARHRAVLDSIAAVVAVAQRRSDSLLIVADRANTDNREARRREGELRTALANATTDAEKLAIYPPLVERLTERAQSAEREATNLRGMYAEQLQRGASLQAALDTSQARNRKLELQLQEVPAVPSPIPRGGRGVLRTIEDAAILATTLKACEASPLSLGCLSGAGLSLVRGVNRIH